MADWTKLTSLKLSFEVRCSYQLKTVKGIAINSFGN